jgi:hypothetical protein
MSWSPAGTESWFRCGRATDSEAAGWKEAGVATVSVYKKGEDEPEREDARYFARMPESRMQTLVDRVAAQVAQAKAARPYRAVMVLCDGSDTIWRQAHAREEFRGAIMASGLLPRCTELDARSQGDLR